MKDFNLTHRDQLDDLFVALRAKVETGGCVVSVKNIKRRRTITQNNCLHQWLTLMAEAMNDAGYSHRTAWEKFSKGFDIPVTMEMLKDIAQNVSYDKFKERHTSKLTTVQMQQLYESLNSAFAQSVQISLSWPDRFNYGDPNN